MVDHVNTEGIHVGFALLNFLSGTLIKRYIWVSLVAQQVRDPALALLWLRLVL